MKIKFSNVILGLQKKYFEFSSSGTPIFSGKGRGKNVKFRILLEKKRTSPRFFRGKVEGKIPFPKQANSRKQKSIRQRDFIKFHKTFTNFCLYIPRCLRNEGRGKNVKFQNGFKKTGYQNPLFCGLKVRGISLKALFGYVA